MNNKTNVSITKDTRNELAKLGTKDSTFEDIIRELLRKWNEGK